MFRSHWDSGFNQRNLHIVIYIYICCLSARGHNDCTVMCLNVHHTQSRQGANLGIWLWLLQLRPTNHLFKSGPILDALAIVPSRPEQLSSSREKLPEHYRAICTINMPLGHTLCGCCPRKNDTSCMHTSAAQRAELLLRRGCHASSCCELPKKLLVTSTSLLVTRALLPAGNSY